MTRSINFDGFSLMETQAAEIARIIDAKTLGTDGYAQSLMALSGFGQALSDSNKIVLDPLGGHYSDGKLVCDFLNNGVQSAASGSAGATAALDYTSMYNGRPMMKYTMGSAGTFQAPFTFTNPVTMAQLRNLYLPVKINRNTTDAGVALWGTATVWFNLSSGGRIQIQLALSGWQGGIAQAFSYAAGAGTQGWGFNGGPTNTSDFDADAATVSSINLVIVVNAGVEEGESIWLGPISMNARRPGILAIELDGTYTSADRWILPMLEEQGLRARLNINHSNIGQPGYMTYPQLDRAQAAGHNIGSHMFTAAVGNGYSAFANEDLIYADIKAGYDNLRARGYHRANYTHVRGGNVNDNSASVPMTKQRMITNAHARAGTKVIRYGNILGGAFTRTQPIAGQSTMNPLNVQGALQVTNTTTVAEMKAVTASARDRGELGVILFHRSVVAGAAALEVLNSDLIQFVQDAGAVVRSKALLNMPLDEAVAYSLR